MSAKEVTTILQKRIDEIKTNVSPENVWRRLMHDLGHLAYENRNTEYVMMLPRIGFLGELLDNYFGCQLKLKVMEKLKRFETLPSIKRMLKAELQNVDRDYFDEDYVLEYRKLKEDLTTLQSLESVGDELNKDYLAKATDALLTILTEAAEEIRKELSDKLEAFFDDVLKDIKEPLPATLISKFDKFILSLHSDTYGW
jgi:hypothetical protein